MPNPHKHSGKSDSDVMAAEWPVASRDLMRDYQRLEQSHRDEEVRKDLFTLIAARKALGDAKIALGAARRFQRDKRTADRLESLSSEITALVERFPLVIVN